MRIWSLHPGHLDSRGLVACWRESLLAQAVLAGRTKGYRQHPQLKRFASLADPASAIGAYLVGLEEEAQRRGYHFDRSRIDVPTAPNASILVTDGQLEHEWRRLGRKLSERSRPSAEAWERSGATAHPLFRVITGGVASWERSEGAQR